MKEFIYKTKGQISIGALGASTFSDDLATLSSETTYYFRAYATNSAGTSYGSILNFTTDASAVTTGQIKTSGQIKGSGTLKITN